LAGKWPTLIHRLKMRISQLRYLTRTRINGRATLFSIKSIQTSISLREHTVSWRKTIPSWCSEEEKRKCNTTQNHASDHDKLWSLIFRMHLSRPLAIIYLILPLVSKVLQISKEFSTTSVTYLDSSDTWKKKKIIIPISYLPFANTRAKVPLNSSMKAGKRFLFDFLGLLGK